MTGGMTPLAAVALKVTSECCKTSRANPPRNQRMHELCKLQQALQAGFARCPTVLACRPEGWGTSASVSRNNASETPAHLKTYRPYQPTGGMGLAKVSWRAGFSTMILWMSASLTPILRSAGRK